MILRTKRAGRGGLQARGGFARLQRRRSSLRSIVPSVLPQARVSELNPQHFTSRGVPDDGAQPSDLVFTRDRPEGTRIFPATVLKRTLTLASDAVVLTLASPFFAVWWTYKMVKRLSGQK